MLLYLCLVLSVLINYSDATETTNDFERKCADGWRYYPKNDDTIRCFKVFTENRVTFSEASRLCSQSMSRYNSQLASFHSREEYDFIVKLQAEEIPLPSIRNSWIGMQHSGKPNPGVPDIKAKNRFKLYFVDHTQMFDFTHMDDDKYGYYWGYDGSGSTTHGWEPNGESKNRVSERCIEIGEYGGTRSRGHGVRRAGHGVMNDNYCEINTFTFICKYKIEPATTTTTTTPSTTTTTTTPTTTTSTSTTTTTAPTTTTTTPTSTTTTESTTTTTTTPTSTTTTTPTSTTTTTPTSTTTTTPTTTTTTESTTTTTTTPTTTTTTEPTTTTTTEPTTTTASTTTTTTLSTPVPITAEPVSNTAAAIYYAAPPYQIWPPPQPAGYNVPTYAIAPPFPPAQPQPNSEYMVLPMYYGYYNGYILPSRNGANDFYNKALRAAFDSSDLEPIDLFES